jgi:DNA-binding IclR family transcriptional regulator
MTKPKSDYAIQTVGNALRLLEIFHGEAELGVSELARRLELHKNNVFRLLATLELDGYVEQSSKTDCYRLGVRCLELGNAYARSCSLSERAGPILEDLVGQLGETAHLGVLRDFEVVHLNGVEARNLLAAVSRIGKRLPSHCSALGKTLLGCASAATREHFDRRLDEEPRLEARTALTLVDRHKLFEQLRVVAGQGFALDLGECEDGLHCAAAPVYGDDEQLVAALSVSGPASRLSEDGLYREVVPVLNAAAAKLSTALGYPG